MSLRPHPPITLAEYERLFRVIHAVVSNESEAPAKASLFFAIAGAYVMGRHHRLKAVCPVAGSAGYNLQSPNNPPLVFGTTAGDKLVSDIDHFHCWIEADGWIVDLTAPLFDAMLPSEQKRGTIPPLMFQKPASPDARIERLTTHGGYIHRANDKLTTSLMKGFTEKPTQADLVRICDQWYARPPKKIVPSIGIVDQHGESKEVGLSRIRLTGAF